MKLPALTACFLALSCASALSAALQTKTIRYTEGGTTFESTFVFDPAAAKPRPGVLMVPNWMGPTETALEKARHVAGDGYVVMMVDMYGVDVRPKDGAEAGAAAGAVRADRALMRARAAKALAEFRAAAGGIGLDARHVAAIGFCFGGGTVLELGRSGADLDGIVTFHGDLASPTLEADAGQTKAKVLVLHGAADPYVPQSDVARFTQAMLPTDVDWQLVEFSHTVHSFTDPTAHMAGQADYNPRSSARAFALMNAFFHELWAP